MMSPVDNRKQIKVSTEMISKLKGLKERMNFITYEEVLWFLLSNREIWIGHMKGQEKKWFLGWSEDLEDIEEVIETHEGPIEDNSWQKIMEKGYFMFKAELDEEESVHLNKDDLKIKNIEIGVIAVPAAAAQEVADRMVEGGRAIGVHAQRPERPPFGALVGIVVIGIIRPGLDPSRAGDHVVDDPLRDRVNGVGVAECDVIVAFPPA